MPHLIALALTLLIILPVPSAQAQAHPDIGIGDRARITSPEAPRGRTVGVLERSTRDTVVLSGRPISRTSITLIEVFAGRKSHWLAGSAVGLVVGAGIGVVSCTGYCDTDIGPVPLGIAGGVLGALVGGLVGGLFIHSDRWETTSLGTLRIQPAASPNGSFGMTVGLRF
jgi:hypothetical protein